MQNAFIPLFGLLIALCGILIFAIGLRLAGSSEIDRRLQKFVVDEIAPEKDWKEDSYVQSQEISGSFMARTIVPLFRRIGSFIGRLVPASSIQQLDRQLVSAGNPMGLHGREFYGIRILFMALGGYLAFLIATRSAEIRFLVLAIMIAAGFFFFPRLWLRSMINKRKNRIRKNLPDALDMLSVCADAGLGFDQSVQRLSEEWDTPLAKEFGRTVAEMSMGQSRPAALRRMAERLDVPEVSSFVAVILQSYEMGMGIVEVLHAQAFQMRVERRFWAQEQARKLPTKMLFPLMLLILPAMFAVILGPIIPAIREVLSQVGF